MNLFNKLHSRICSSPYYDKMIRFATPLSDHLGINHFWYYKITDSGHYSYFGTHTTWSEYCYSSSQMLQAFPCLRHPKNLQKGINLMQRNTNDEFRSVLVTAQEKFRINFSLNLTSSISNGLEAFGFATRYNDPFADERLLNELPLLNHFTKILRKENQKLFDLLEDNQVDLSEQFGVKFFERSKTPLIPFQREQFLDKIGHRAFLALTSREKEVLSFVANGYPASYIAQQLHLSKRTVESHLDNLKMKLSCDSKVELIQIAKDFVLINL